MILQIYWYMPCIPMLCTEEDLKLHVCMQLYCVQLSSWLQEFNYHVRKGWYIINDEENDMQWRIQEKSNFECFILCTADGDWTDGHISHFGRTDIQFCTQ